MHCADSTHGVHASSQIILLQIHQFWTKEKKKINTEYKTKTLFDDRLLYNNSLTRTVLIDSRWLSKLNFKYSEKYILFPCQFDFDVSDKINEKQESQMMHTAKREREADKSLHL